MGGSASEFRLVSGNRGRYIVDKSQSLSKPRSRGCHLIYVREPGEYGEEISSNKDDGLRFYIND